MSLLTILLAKKQNRAIATLKVTTDATHGKGQLPTVARVAIVTVAKPESALISTNDKMTPAPRNDSDLWCWPRSQAMNTGELDDFTWRMARFIDKGVSLEDAERLSDDLVRRDREGDDRRLCLECTYVLGNSRWRCNNKKVVKTDRNFLPNDFVLCLQRCDGFVEFQGI